MSGDLAAWLRAILNADLTEWRSRKAHFLAVREKEGDYYYVEARERVARCTAELAILREHRHVPTRTGHYGTPFDFGCRTCHEMSDPDGNSDVMADGWCETVRQLGWGYRFRGGYRKAEWEPYLITITRRCRARAGTTGGRRLPMPAGPAPAGSAPSTAPSTAAGTAAGTAAPGRTRVAE